MDNAVCQEIGNPKNILIIGASGQLGSELCYLVDSMKDKLSMAEALNGYNFIFTTRKELDIQSIEQVAEFFQKNTIDLIVNCAAYTAVYKAEKEAGQDNAINHLAVKYLSVISKEKKLS